MTADELNAGLVLLLAFVFVVLVCAGLLALGIARAWRVVRMAVRYRRDKHLRFDWSRAFRMARRHV